MYVIFLNKNREKLPVLIKTFISPFEAFRNLFLLAFS